MVSKFPSLASLHCVLVQRWMKSNKEQGNSEICYEEKWDVLSGNVTSVCDDSSSWKQLTRLLVGFNSCGDLGQNVSYVHISGCQISRICHKTLVSYPSSQCSLWFLWLTCKDLHLYWVLGSPGPISSARLTFDLYYLSFNCISIYWYTTWIHYLVRIG